MYEFKWLNEKLLYIKLNTDVSSEVTRLFIKEIYAQLNKRTIPFYILVDLRLGIISDQQVLSRIKFLTHHDRWAGSVAFHRDPVSDISNTTFQSINLCSQDKDRIFNIPEEALAHLESLESGLTDNIDWYDVLMTEVKH